MQYDLTDIHQHVLWGVDDGAETPEIMQSMLRQSSEQNIRVVAAACHAAPGLRPFDLGLYRERLAEAQNFCRRENLDVRVIAGAEVQWTWQTVTALQQGQIPTLGDTNCVLLELWETIGWEEARSAVKQVLRAGFTPILAHTERYWCFALQPKKAIELRNELGVGYQVNASTILAPRWPFEQHFIKRMLAEQALDAVASDAHDCERRPILLRKAFDELTRRCEKDYARALAGFDGVLHQ